MRKSKPLILLCIMGIIIFPWKLIDLCATHPLGHTHHHHDGPSPCELRKQFKGVTAYWPPMDCYKISAHANDFQLPEKVKPSFSSVALVVTFLVIAEVEIEEESFVLIPDPGCNSDPPLGKNYLRGPPLV